MKARWKASRRELTLFVVLAVIPAVAVMLLYRLYPWPTPMRAQADGLGLTPTVLYLLEGALGVAVLPWTGATLAPRLGSRNGWVVLVGISLVLGLIYGATDLGISHLTDWGEHLKAVDARNGLSTTFINVRPPWSLPHYLHASIVSECAFRLGPILILTWLVAWVALKGRYEPVVYWVFSGLAACIEPIEKALFLRKWGILGDTPLAVVLSLEAIAWQFAFAVLLRKFGWPAPILARLGYYLIVRAFHQ